MEIKKKSKALLAEVFKLLGNSGYGKLIEALERQTNTIYTKKEKIVDQALRSAFFSDLDEIGEAYELESRKPRITIRRPFQVGIAVYQLAKLRTLDERCSKCYYVDEPEGKQKKFSTKGVSKKQNEITWQRFKKALEGNKDIATNRGFRMRDGQIVTYEQQKLGLSAYYDKRWVLEDGIHTEPIEFYC